MCKQSSRPPLEQQHGAQHQRASNDADDSIKKKGVMASRYEPTEAYSIGSIGYVLDGVVQGGEAMRENSAADQKHGDSSGDRQALHQPLRHF
jgi:hypothetical protein